VSIFLGEDHVISSPRNVNRIAVVSLTRSAGTSFSGSPSNVARSTTQVPWIALALPVSAGGGRQPGQRSGHDQQGILGYHGAFAGPNGSTIRYAVVAYPGGTVGNSSMRTAGFLQADAYGGYDGIYTGSNGMIAEVGCWAG